MEQNDFNTTQMDSRERLRTLYLQPGDVIAGNYEFVRELGHGGMGMVCLCRDLVADGRLMAVKTVPDILRHDDDAVAALTQEYNNMYDLRHDNIVSVRHLLKDEFRYYIVMDYLEGESLETYLK
ncbi:MAG: protein kinase, partial [Victivallales bacterium]|nr:protein kinase [Victivallales bacterium]